LTNWVNIFDVVSIAQMYLVRNINAPSTRDDRGGEKKSREKKCANIDGKHCLLFLPRRVVLMLDWKELHTCGSGKVTRVSKFGAGILRSHKGNHLELNHIRS
jgi:hypothetical protein